MGNTAEKNIEKYPHMLDTMKNNHEGDSAMVTLSDEPPLYRYDFFDRNKQLLDFHIMSQTKSHLFNTFYDCKLIYKTIFEYADLKDLFNFSFTCRLAYIYWTRDDEIWRNLLPHQYKMSILSAQPLNYQTYGIRSWKDCCRSIYCKDMWKRLNLQYEFVSGSMCSNNSNEEEDDDFMLDANSSKKCQSKKSDKSNALLSTQHTEELRIHFICDDKKQSITRYLKSILKHCKEPHDTNYRLSKKFSNFFDRRVARVKDKKIQSSSTNGNNNGNHQQQTLSNSSGGNAEYEIQCLVGTSLRPNCSCKFICIDLMESSYQWNHSTTTISDQDMIKDYLSKEMECGDTIREYLSGSNSCNNNNNTSTSNLSLVVVGLSYTRTTGGGGYGQNNNQSCCEKINPNMLRLCKALSNEYSLPYIEIDVGKRSGRRDLLFYYSVYCHSRKMTSQQLKFLQTNNTNDEWLL